MRKNTEVDYIRENISIATLCTDQNDRDFYRDSRIEREKKKVQIYVKKYKW